MSHDPFDELRRPIPGVPSDQWPLVKDEPPPAPRLLQPVPPLTTPTGGPSRYALRALEAEETRMREATQGHRNNTLNLCAFNLSQLVAGGALEATLVEDTLTQAALATGLPLHEIEATLASGTGAGAQHPRGVPPRDGDSSPQESPSPGPGEEGALLLNPILDWAELFSTDTPEEEWVLPPLLPARRMVALYSAPKVGKSLLMLELAVAIATGTPALGQPATGTPRRVLYVDFENDPQGDIRTRLTAMGYGPHDLENLCYLSFPSLAKFDTPTGATDLLRHLTHYSCEVCVIDTVSRAVTGEENDNDTWLAFYRHTGLALKQAGVSCIRLDHSGKDTQKGMRGGSAKYGDVDAVWKLEKITDTTLHLECTDHRMPVPLSELTLTRGGTPIRHTPLQGAAQAAAQEGKVAEYINLLDLLEVPLEATQAVAKAALRGHGASGDNGVMVQAIKLRKLRVEGWQK